MELLEKISRQIAAELNVAPRQVAAAIVLLDGGATVPFIARYRKEITGGLDDTELRTLDERLRYLRELEDRRAVILASIAEQGKLSDELRIAIDEADTKVRLEDLYLPYKPKRRTKAQIAKEAGLEPLALALYGNPQLVPEQEAERYLNPEQGVADVKAALEGARHILMEQFAEDADLLAHVRGWLWDNAVLVAKVAEGKEQEGAKFADYFNYAEAIRAIPSHRALALFRGRNEDFLQLTLEETAPPAEPVPVPAPQTPGYCERRIAAHFGIVDQGRAADRWLLDTARWTWRVKLRTSLEVELFTRLREAAEEEAIKVFASNLKDLLLAAPAGQLISMGLDPGVRTGVKVALVDQTGKLVEHGVIYPHPPRNQWDESIQVLALLAEKYQVKLISIGNGTASRETDRLVADVLQRHPKLGLQKLVVSEAGASVYSASALAAEEFPDLDVSIRGAVSIARRLQDPLAELVKIDPKSIGVGQYQHDVNQSQLARALDGVVEDCVNAVGVDLNMASAPLLARVSGLNKTLAKNIVEFRDSNGAFRNRAQLKKVPRLGDKTFEQAAGFLRITNGDNALDASGVHPEAYPVVERIVAKTGKPVQELIGNHAFLQKLKPADFTDDFFGVPTVSDILQELDKPGRDPRPEFKTAAFRDGVETLADLQLDMILEGVVTNVTNFGAFVDIGVHQDGLVHVSALSDRFVRDPREVVKTGQVVKVKVLEVDIPRKRVALTMRLQDNSRDHLATTPPARNNAATGNAAASKAQRRVADAPPPANSALAEAFARARRQE